MAFATAIAIVLVPVLFVVVERLSHRGLRGTTHTETPERTAPSRPVHADVVSRPETATMSPLACRDRASPMDPGVISNW